MWGALSDERTGLSFTLLVLASAGVLGFKSRGTRDHILLSHIRDSPISSPPTTRRASVELFDPASTREMMFLAASFTYIFSGRTSWKTLPLPSNGRPLLSRIFVSFTYQRAVYQALLQV
jgi:hypothetical protein